MKGFINKAFFKFQVAFRVLYIDGVVPKLPSDIFDIFTDYDTKSNYTLGVIARN